MIRQILIVSLNANKGCDTHYFSHMMLFPCHRRLRSKTNKLLTINYKYVLIKEKTGKQKQNKQFQLQSLL